MVIRDRLEGLGISPKVEAVDINTEPFAHIVEYRRFYVLFCILRLSYLLLNGFINSWLRLCRPLYRLVSALLSRLLRFPLSFCNASFRLLHRLRSIFLH